MATIPIPTGTPTAERRSSIPTVIKTAKPKPTAKNTGGLSAELYAQYPLTQEWAYANDITNSAQPVGQGWDATATPLNSKRLAAAVNASNAIITDGSGDNAFQMSIFVSDTEMDSAITGTTAQSQMVQDFYPHSFVAPSIVVTGWSLDQSDYGLLCEFIHNCQYKSITSNSSSWPSFMTQLWVFGRDRNRGTDGTRQNTKGVTLSNPQNIMPNYQADPIKGPKGVYYNQTIRGSHQPTVAKGYIQTMPRIHAQFEYAVQWQFSFVVAAMLQGLYSESASLSKSILGLSTNSTNTWQNMLADAENVGVSTVTAQQNRSSLSYAASNAATLVGAPPTGASSSANTASVTPSGSQQQQVSQVASQYGLSPKTVWGVYGTESTFGTNPSNSGSGPNGGAKGPFQFEDSTWAEYGDGGNVMNFSDALTAACKYLAALGANSNPTSAATITAINNYNGNNGGADANTAYALSVIKFGNQFGS